jgi:hypothetical protein
LKSQTQSLLRTQIFWNSRSADTCPTRSMVLLPLRMFDLSTQINGHATLFSIDGRDLLQVFRLLRSQISNFAFTQMLLSKGCDPLTCVLLIQRSRITLGIYPECMDLRHVPLRSGGCKSLWDFTRSSRIRATSPLDLTVQILLQVFGSSHSSDFSSQTEKPTSTFPELEIYCQVSPHRSTALVSLGIRASDVSTLQPLPSSGSSGLSTRNLLDQ